MFRPHFVR